VAEVAADNADKEELLLEEEEEEALVELAEVEEELLLDELLLGEAGEELEEDALFEDEEADVAEVVGVLVALEELDPAVALLAPAAEAVTESASLPTPSGTSIATRFFIKRFRFS